MSEIIGKQIEVGIGIEDTRGTAPATAERWVKKITANIVPKSEKKVDESTMNVLEESLGARVVKKWFEGELDGNVQVDMIGYLLYNVYGAVSSAVVSGSVYGHTFTLENSIQHPSLTLYAKDGSISQEAYQNAMISSLEISASVDDYVKFKAGFMAKDSVANTSTPSYSTEYDFIGKDVSVKFADTESGLAGATAIKLKDISIKWDLGLLVNHVLGAYAPDDIYNTNSILDIDFTIDYSDDTYKDLYTADTYKYMQIVIEGDAVIGGALHPSITMILNRVQVMDWNRNDGGASELVDEPISVKAFYNTTDEEASSLVLQNLTTEYDIPLS